MRCKLKPQKKIYNSNTSSLNRGWCPRLGGDGCSFNNWEVVMSGIFGSGDFSDVVRYVSALREQETRIHPSHCGVRQWACPKYGAHGKDLFEPCSKGGREVFGTSK